MKIYNKLVRDKILDIIKRDGESPVSRKLSLKEFKHEALKKVVEEAQEILGAENSKDELIKEIADLEEVLKAVMDAYKITRAEVNKIKNKRKSTRGAFEKRIFLEKTL
jgi:predicted house-cleaning noncanonical NTP pyrophosphatase (MazG superfamily)